MNLVNSYLWFSMYMLTSEVVELTHYIYIYICVTSLKKGPHVAKIKN